MGVSLEKGMTNCYPLLISFVVKSPLIRDCLVEIALHQTQLQLVSLTSIADTRSTICLPFILVRFVIPTPEISPPSDRFSLHILNTATACGERKGHLAVVNVSFCVFVFIETVFKCLQISYHADVTSKKEKKKRMAERNYSSGMCNREIQIHSCRPVVQPGAA